MVVDPDLLLIDLLVLKNDQSDYHITHASISLVNVRKLHCHGVFGTDVSFQSITIARYESNRKEPKHRYYISFPHVYTPKLAYRAD